MYYTDLMCPILQFFLLAQSNGTSRIFCSLQTLFNLCCLLFVFISQLFFFLHFPPNIAHPFGVKQRIKPPKPDHPPCNLAKQMMNTRCFSETLAANDSRCPWWQLVCMTKCTTLMAAKAWLDAPLSFPFTLRCLLTPEMLELMWK